MGSGHTAGWLTAGLIALLPGMAAAACAPTTIDLRGPGGTQRFTVELADEGAERAQGLMFRDSMPSSCAWAKISCAKPCQLQAGMPL